MVPAPESKRSRLWAISIKTEQLLLFKEGTHVPEPSILIFMIYSTLHPWNDGVLARPGATSAKQATALENQVWAREYWSSGQRKRKR
ncbi:MAG: hypothetical protein KAU38_04380 [Desulfobacterales bacterium]|nr:hypothetical protein [Desulfobacterales bacterium]